MNKTKSLEIWVLLSDAEINSQRVFIPCKGDLLPLTIQNTFYDPVIKINDKNLIGVQLEPDVVDNFIQASGGAGLWDSLLKLDEIHMVDFYVCRRDEPEILIAKYPQLAEISDKLKWKGVVQ